jgi:hypothetical protein
MPLHHAQTRRSRQPKSSSSSSSSSSSVRLPPDFLLVDKRGFEIVWVHSPDSTCLDLLDNLSKFLLGGFLAAQGPEKGRQLPDHIFVVHQVLWNHSPIRRCEVKELVPFSASLHETKGFGVSAQNFPILRGNHSAPLHSADISRIGSCLLAKSPERNSLFLPESPEIARKRIFIFAHTQIHFHFVIVVQQIQHAPAFVNPLSSILKQFNRRLRRPRRQDFFASCNPQSSILDPLSQILYSHSVAPQSPARSRPMSKNVNSYDPDPEQQYCYAAGEATNEAIADGSQVEYV